MNQDIPLGFRGLMPENPILKTLGIPIDEYQEALTLQYGWLFNHLISTKNFFDQNSLSLENDNLPINNSVYKMILHNASQGVWAGQKIEQFDTNHETYSGLWHALLSSPNQTISSWPTNISDRNDGLKELIDSEYNYLWVAQGIINRNSKNDSENFPDINDIKIMNLMPTEKFVKRVLQYMKL